jgi:hypothetical protein
VPELLVTFRIIAQRQKKGIGFSCIDKIGKMVYNTANFSCVSYNKGRNTFASFVLTNAKTLKMKTGKKVSDGSRHPGVGKNNKNTKAKKVSGKATAKLKPFVHPELQPGEMFLANVSDEYVNIKSGNASYAYAIGSGSAARKNLEEYGFKSKRLGFAAYNSDNGKRIQGMRPIFIKKAEYDKHQAELQKKNQPFVHPELKRGEVLFCDIDDTFVPISVHTPFGAFMSRAHMKDGQAIEMNFSAVPFKKKRLGTFSYDKKGKKLYGLVPVFVLKKDKIEFDKNAKKKVDAFWRSLTKSKAKKKK